VPKVKFDTSGRKETGENKNPMEIVAGKVYDISNRMAEIHAGACEIVGESEEPEEPAVSEDQLAKIVGPGMSARLRDAGLFTAEQILTAGLDGLLEVNGLGDSRARKILDQIKAASS
jgi:hypothetical protein